MDMKTIYNGKCDKCNRENPKLYMKVYRDRGDGASTEIAWCLECVRNAGLFQFKWWIGIASPDIIPFSTY